MSAVKVCLFNTSMGTGLYPLGVAYLSSWLKKYGKHQYEISLVDVNTHKDPSAEIGRRRPDVVGVTCHSPTALYVCRESRKIRALLPDALMVAGGPHPTLRPEDLLNHGAFDVAVIGEGEITFQELVDGYHEAGRRIADVDFSCIRGLLYRKAGSYARSQVRELIKDLDSIPHPDRGIFDRASYERDYYVLRGANSARMTSIMTSRGCPNNCFFCSANAIGGGKVRYHSPGYVIEELNDLIESCHPGWLFFSDDTFFVNKARAEEICDRIISAGIHKKLRWEVQIRSSEVKEKDLPILCKMKKAGCQTLNFGFESGNPRILAMLKGKRISIEDHERAIELTKRAGLQVLGTFVVGVPTETRAEMEDTEKFIRKHLKDMYRYQTFILKPYPGTEFFRVCVERGLLKPDYFANLEAITGDYGFESGKVTFNDCVPAEDIIAMKSMLDTLSLKKIHLLEYVRWGLHNLIRTPRKFLDGTAWVGSNLVKRRGRQTKPVPDPR